MSVNMLLVESQTKDTGEKPERSNEQGWREKFEVPKQGDKQKEESGGGDWEDGFGLTEKEILGNFSGDHPEAVGVGGVDVDGGLTVGEKGFEGMEIHALVFEVKKNQGRH